jgi:hypothetical protein
LRNSSGSISTSLGAPHFAQQQFQELRTFAVPVDPITTS